MANDTWATGDAIAGDSGSVHYDDTNTTSEAWFALTTTPDRLYTFTCDAATYYFEVYSGPGPEWSGLTFVTSGYEAPMSFIAAAGVEYAIVMWPSTGDNNNIAWTGGPWTAGWSEWIQDPPIEWVADIVKEYDYPLGDFPNEVVALDSASWGGHHIAPDSEVVWYTISGGVTVGADRTGMLATPVTGWADFRDWSPDAIAWPKVEGVDFAVIPGKDPDVDLDAYVEYEVGATVLTGWHLPDVDATWDPQRIAADSVDPPGSQLQVELVFDLPPVAPGDAPYFPGIGSGTILGILGPPLDSESFTAIPDPGPVSSVALFGYDPNFSATPPIAPGGGHYSVEGDLYWTSRPYTLIQCPRYRYWKITPTTGTLPLRQFQRDDGLVGSTFRHGGGTSRQGSIRQLGYY